MEEENLPEIEIEGEPSDPVPGLVHDIADQYELMREETK